MLENKLEPQVQKENNKVDLERIAWNTLGYAIVGSGLGGPAFGAPIGAAIGCGVTTYDELKGRKSDLFTPVIGAVIGGILGYMVNSTDLAEEMPNLTTYVGSIIGGALGTYNSFKDYEQKKEKKK